MWSKKTPKSQKSETGMIACYHKQGPLETPNPLFVVSIDPATRNGNYALRMEQLFYDGGSLRITPLIFTRLELGDSPHIKLTELLNASKGYLSKVHMLLIERQLPENYKSVRIQQHTQSWFLHNAPVDPSQFFAIYELDPRLKSKTLGANSHLNSTGLKAWSIEKAREILQQRGDIASLDLLNNTKRKLDDLCDTVTQAAAAYVYLFSSVLPG